MPGNGINENSADSLLEVPAWLNKNFLEKALRKYFTSQTITIQSYVIEAATGKGENFASAMYRVKSTCSGLKDKPQSFNFIVKVPYESGFGLDLLNTMDAYDKELEMYEYILPRLTKTLKENHITEDIFATTIYVSYSKKAIVFEDLSLKDYRMPARSDGLDMAHAKMLLTNLAIFHASAAQLCESKPDVFKNFTHGMINRRNRSFDNFYLTALDALTELISKWENFGKLTEKLKRLRPHLMDKGRVAFDAKDGHFNTLIHGDIWVNNSMFTYDTSGEPNNMMLVDFQFCCWTSPTIDLHYFFNTSLREELRMHHQDELVQWYHAVLVKTLQTLGYRGHVPTLLEFHGEFLQNSFYGFISSCLVQPIMINECTEDADIDALHGCDERALRFKRTLFSNPKVHSIVRHLLPIFDKKGLLDV